MIIELNQHHVNRLRRLLEATDHASAVREQFVHTPPEYKAGTHEEQNTWLGAKQQSLQALKACLKTPAL